MATDIEKLVVQLSADIKGYENEMRKAMGVTNRQARAIEVRWKSSERNLNALGANMARGLIAPLTGVAAALTTREVMAYADAWTKAKNSLAVAGVTGVQQAAVMDRLFQSAQANSTPIEALAELFGKAAQASDNLGASTEDLVNFSDGVAVAQWDEAESDPALAISDAADGMVTRPNCMVIGRERWSKLRRHPRLLKATSVSGTDQGALTLQAAQDALEIPEIIVGEGWINLQRQGQAPVRQRVWGKHAVLFYRAPQVAPTGTVMTFGWTQSYLGTVSGQIPEPKIGLRGSVRVRVGHSVKELIAAPEAGFLFSDIVK